MQIYDIFVWRETKGLAVSDESQVFSPCFEQSPNVDGRVVTISDQNETKQNSNIDNNGGGVGDCGGDVLGGDGLGRGRRCG